MSLRLNHYPEALEKVEEGWPLGGGNDDTRLHPHNGILFALFRKGRKGHIVASVSHYMTSCTALGFSQQARYPPDEGRTDRNHFFGSPQVVAFCDWQWKMNELRTDVMQSPLLFCPQHKTSVVPNSGENTYGWGVFRAPTSVRGHRRLACCYSMQL